MGSSFRLVHHSLTPVRPFLNARSPRLVVDLDTDVRHAMVGEMHGAFRALPRRASVLLFMAALMLAAFAGGVYVARYRVFPYDLLRTAYKTFTVAVAANLLTPSHVLMTGFVDVPPDQAADRRFEFIGSDHLTDPILVPGGPYRFREYCPDHVGCLAVEYTGRGEVRQAWPYRPDVLEKRLEKEEFTQGFLYEHVIGWSFLDHSRIMGVLKYANGDLLVVFRFSHTHPYGGRGGLPKGVSVFDALTQSPYASLLTYTDPCDPTHVNSVHPLGEDAAGAGLEPGDLVVSMRNLHAFAVLDRETHRLKRLVRGGFMMQHSVLHFEGSRFLLLDNQGGRTADGALSVSRLLMVDAASGEETTIFPNHRTPGHLRELYTQWRGGVAISPDRRRALVTFTQEGKAVEVRIADGAVLVVFDSIHDVSHVEKFSEERSTRAARIQLREVRYGANGKP